MNLRSAWVKVLVIYHQGGRRLFHICGGMLYTQPHAWGSHRCIGKWSTYQSMDMDRLTIETFHQALSFCESSSEALID
jgi:hypothetical protein